MPKPLSVLSVLLLAGAVRGQENPGPINTLNFDTSKLQVTVTLDRSVYLPGEAAEIALDVWNPGTATTALKPFTAATGCIDLVRAAAGDPREIFDPLCLARAVDSSTTSAFGFNEHKRKTLNSYDNRFEVEISAFPEAGGAPSKAGAYRLIYRYGTSVAAADFTVAAPKLEAKAVARVGDELFKEDPAQEQLQVLKMFVHVLALRLDNQTYICVAQAPVVQDSDLFRNADGSFNPGGARPLRRIATSAAPVVSLSATADRDDNLTITWMDAAGGKHSQEHRDGFPASQTWVRKRQQR